LNQQIPIENDMTRTFFVGEPTRPMSKMYKAVLEAQFAGIDAVRPAARVNDFETLL
jgi:Xaa-Pro aminopeptidase